MNNKFIKTLVIINGILIPIFILSILGIFINDVFKNHSTETTAFEENNTAEFTIKFSRPQEIPNSENYFVSKYRSDEINEILGEPELRIGEVQENTVNIVFLNSNFEKIGMLLENDGSISEIFVPNFFANHEEQKLTKYIAYLIANEDSNNDGRISLLDEHHLYISDLDGNALKQVVDRKVKHFKFINESTEILVTYFENSNDLAVGVYDIEGGQFSKKANLDFND